MCLAAAARILSVSGVGVERFGVVEMGGRERSIGLAMVPGADAGAWVTVHAGYALGLLTEEEAGVLAGLSDEIAGLL